MPVPETLGVLCPCHASAHPCHCLSRHIGSSPFALVGELGKHTHSLVPLRSSDGFSPSLAGQSRMVACLPISAGAALSAWAIFSAFDIFLPVAAGAWLCC